MKKTKEIERIITNATSQEFNNKYVKIEMIKLAKKFFKCEISKLEDIDNILSETLNEYEQL